MGRTINACLDDSNEAPEASRVAEIALGSDGGSFSIVTRNGAEGLAQVSLSAGEVPRLIVALLHTAEVLERWRGGEPSLVFPVKQGTITVWQDDFVFRLALAENASMTFQLSRAAAASLFEALSTAFRCTAFLQATATH